MQKGQMTSDYESAGYRGLGGVLDGWTGGRGRFERRIGFL